MSQQVKIKILLKIKLPHFKLEKINSKLCKNFATVKTTLSFSLALIVVEVVLLHQMVMTYEQASPYIIPKLKPLAG
jgi:hypothetical protein